MPYSSALMTLIFIKSRQDEAGRPISLAAPKRLSGAAVRWADVQRLSFRSRASEATRPANTCVSTPSLCNANFARS
jgi:hypothetical protein